MRSRLNHFAPSAGAWRHNERSKRSSTEDKGAMEALRFGPTAGAATPAVVAAAMPRSGGAQQRRGDVASLAYVAEVEGAA